MGKETVLARIVLQNTEALTLCDGIKALLEKAGLQPDLIVHAKTGEGEVIQSLLLVEDTLSDGSHVYNMVIRLA